MGRPKNKIYAKGNVFKSNSCGEYEIISYHNARDIRVKFLATGYETTTSTMRVSEGAIKDPMMPIVSGVGFFGVGKRTSVADKRAYSAWCSMLRRCYNAKSKSETPSYSECVVCDEWHNFQVFAEWFSDNLPSGNDKYELDKDKLSGKCKVYSPSTCTFLTKKENLAIAMLKEWSFISPDGDTVIIKNLVEFCHNNDLCAHRMRRIHKSKGLHRGWRPL